MKTMSYKRMLSALAVAAVLAMTATACGKKGTDSVAETTDETMYTTVITDGEGNQVLVKADADGNVVTDDKGNPIPVEVNSENLPVDAKMTDIAYEQTKPQTESAVVSETESTTESTTEDSSEASDSSEGEGDSDSGSENGGDGGSGSGGSGNWDDNPDLSVRNAYANLSWFRVYKGSEGMDNSLRDTNKFDYFTDKNHLNYFGGFSEISGEEYKGYLTEAFNFSGQAYWLTGEGNQKCYIETNDKNEIMAIAFTNVSSDFAMQFDCVCPYIHCDSLEDVDKFRAAYKNGADSEPYVYNSGDGKCEILTFNDGGYSLSLELVFDDENNGALKTIMISDNKR